MIIIPVPVQTSTVCSLSGTPVLLTCIPAEPCSKSSVHPPFLSSFYGLHLSTKHCMTICSKVPFTVTKGLLWSGHPNFVGTLGKCFEKTEALVGLEQFGNVEETRELRITTMT